MKELTESIVFSILWLKILIFTLYRERKPHAPLPPCFRKYQSMASIILKPKM